MKKKYILYILLLSFVIVVTIISAFMIYKNISGKINNNVYYRSIVVRKIYNEYYIDGDIYNKSDYQFEDAYIDLVITGVDNQDYDYEIYVGKIEGLSKTYRINVTGEDFLSSGNNVKIKEVYIKETFDGEKIRIYDEIKKTQRSFNVYFPVYATIIVAVIEISGLLVLFGLLAKYNSEVHSVSKSQRERYLNQSSSVTEFTCQYCGYTTRKFHESCPKCGANLTRK